MTPFPAPDRARTPELKAVIWKLSLGSLIILSLVILAAAIAIGKVQENTSYGLIPVLTIVGKFCLDFSEWCFRGGRMHDELGPAPSVKQLEITSPPAPPAVAEQTTQLPKPSELKT